MIAQAAVEEGIVVGGGCTLLRLASKVDAIKETLENDEQKVDEYAEIFMLNFVPFVVIRLLKNAFCLKIL